LAEGFPISLTVRNVPAYGQAGIELKNSKPNGIGKAWLATIQAACPRGVVDMAVDYDQNHFTKLYSRLRRALARIKGAAILYERDWSGDTVGSEATSISFSFDDNDFEGDWADAGPGTSFSHHLFFVGSSDPAMQVACESESEVDDQGTLETVAGKETYGYLVGVSLLAPVTMVQPDSYACFEDGSASCPDLRDEWHEATDPLFGSGENLAGSLDEGTARALKQLRRSIAGVLVSARLKELPSDLARVVVPLRAGSEAFLGKGHTGHPITVQDAFFFAGL
jgi:hypothetical protein